MIKIKETVIVEGKHDKIKLKSIIDANIITTDGFRIFNNKEKQALIRNIAEKTGIIIITDSDTAGRNIRNFVKNCVKNCEKNNRGGEKSKVDILNIYIPKIIGKERRKSTASKENLLGVEGTDKDILIDTLNKFGIKDTSIEKNAENAKNAKKIEKADKTEIKKITKLDFYEDKLTGHEKSSEKRKYICDMLTIPYMSSNSLIEALNILIDYDEYKKIISELKN